MVNALEIRFNFSRDDQVSDCTEEFDIFSSTLEDDINDRAEELLDDLNEDSGVEWKFDGFEVESYDGDCADPNDFDNLNEYGEYVGNVELHGEAYVMRYEDIGEHDFDDSFAGTFDSPGDWAEEFVSDCYDLRHLPDFLKSNINWENVADDLRMDYSEYEGSEGYHYFRD